MKIKIITILALIAVGLTSSISLAEVKGISQTQLAKEADLIVIGNVTGVEDGKEGAKYAAVAVEETFKGSCAPQIKVKFIYNPDMEADVQDPNLGGEKKVLLYLRFNKQDKEYRVVRGWSGVGRFYGGNFYHQYDAVDFQEYITQLKKGR